METAILDSINFIIGSSEEGSVKYDLIAQHANIAPHHLMTRKNTSMLLFLLA
jgi:hypothetical protein